MKYTIHLKIIISLYCALLIFKGSAQNSQSSPDSIFFTKPSHGIDRYHAVLRYHDPIMYIAFPFVQPVVERKVPLGNGEGKSGYWLEGNFAYRFVIYKGKYYSSPFLQRARFTFDVGITSRITRDNSNPLLPSNNKLGFGLDFLLSGLNDLKKENSTLVWTTMQLHHYSNGQADSFFINNSVQRNNYRSGDFSTNYFKVTLSIAGVHSKNIISGAFGYQREVDLGGPLSRNKEFINYYGDNRLLFNFQITKNSKLVAVKYQNRSTEKTDSIKVYKRRQLAFRSELEYILGNLSKFDGSNKYRLGVHAYLTYMPSVTNEVGFMIHAFWGRDYLNIRFDDVVFIGELGLFVKFNSK